MIKITFEFKTVGEAIQFLSGGGTVDAGTPLTVKDVVDVLRETKPIENDFKSVHKRKSRVGKGATSKVSLTSAGASKAASVRKKGSAKTKKAPAPVSDEITDADLSKAASIAAGEITPLKVTAILEQFGVGQVSELKDEQRREFLDLLDEAIEAEK